MKRQQAISALLLMLALGWAGPALALSALAGDSGWLYRTLAIALLVIALLCAVA